MNTIRTLYSRDHTTIFPKQGVFLAGATPADGAMTTGWRRVVVEALQKDPRLTARMTVVSPEPESGYWDDIDTVEPNNELSEVLNKQIPWELQYLYLCDITAFWLPTYWKKDKAGPYDDNIGPTSRWEFGFFLQEYLKNRDTRSFIIGSPEDAESLKWAKFITNKYDIQWHVLKKEDKDQLVAPSFIEEIATTLFKNSRRKNEITNNILSGAIE